MTATDLPRVRDNAGVTLRDRLDALASSVERAPWPWRWYLRHRLRKLERTLADRRDAMLRDYFRD